MKNASARSMNPAALYEIRPQCHHPHVRAVENSGKFVKEILTLVHRSHHIPISTTWQLASARLAPRSTDASDPCVSIFSQIRSAVVQTAPSRESSVACVTGSTPVSMGTRADHTWEERVVHRLGETMEQHGSGRVSDCKPMNLPVRVGRCARAERGEQVSGRLEGDDAAPVPVRANLVDVPPDVRA